MRTGVNVRAATRVGGALAFGLALCLGLMGGQASAGLPAGAPAGITAAQSSKIEAAVLQDTANGKKAEFMIVMADQANVDAANSMKDQDARGWYVYNTLKSHAERTQAGIRSSLAASKVAYKSFWVLNALLVSGDRTLVENIATRSDVGKIISNRETRWIEDPQIANPSDANVSPNTIEWGVNNVNAPQVWAMGFTGQGIVIANQDTGMRWTHNAIKPKYRGWNGASADHNYNWWDAIHSGGGSCTPNHQEPCDDQGHGTHTTGTTVGDDGAGNQVGVAPGAKWIGCRNMDQGNGTPATYTECFQFFIAPTDLTGANPNPALRPHVMNNSWGCPASEGCSAESLHTIVQNTQAAGIFVEVSAGNAGPGCSSVNDPPAIYAESFSTGAIDISNAIAGFSSRGPVTLDGSNRRKPDVSAPGVNVRSTTRTSDTSYGNLSGTSMAGPHVVGVVALLWSARPQLERDIATTKAVLENTANPNVVVSPVQTCGGIPSSQIPNNTFGYGRVDALAAVNSVQQGTPTPTGTGTPPTATRTRTPTMTAIATATPCGASGNYTIATAAGTVVAGTTNTGSACDDCVVDVTLPFPFQLYDQTFTAVGLDSNGKAHFPTGASVFTNTCLPGTGMTYTIFPYWDDQRTDAAGSGIFTSVSGTAPNRIFNIEWRTTYFSGGGTANYNLRLYECVGCSQSRFDVIYGTVTQGNTSATGGVQKNGTGFTQDFCNGAGGATTGVKIYTLPISCGSITPVATSTATRTSTVAATATRTSTVPGVTATATCPPVEFQVGPGNPAKPVSIKKGNGPFRANGSGSGSGNGQNGAYVPSGGVTFVLDDGTVENSIGWTDATQNFRAVWINRFSLAAGQFPVTLNQISIKWPNSTALLTKSVALLVYLDADGNGDPSNAVKLAQVAGTISIANGTTFQDYPVSVLVPGPGDVYIGFSDIYNTGGVSPRTFPAPLDTTATQGRSWVAAQNVGDADLDNLGNNDNLGTIDDLTGGALTGNWVIRASGTLSGGGCPPTSTVVVTNTPAATTAVPTNTPIAPCLIQFIDVPPGHTFYDSVRCLACRGIVSGYSDGTFRPNNPVTRGQLAKMVSNAAGFTEGISGQTFADVPPSNTFYVWIERLTRRGHMSGYVCGGPGEPCINNMPYFRPFANATRGQTSKIVSNAAGFTEMHTGQTFQDVPPTHTFYQEIERLASRNVMGGYPCGGPGEPCIAPQNRPYFRPGNDVTRGQSAKIVANTFYPGCVTP